MLEEDDELGPAVGIAIGCVLGVVAWALIVGGIVLLCAAVVLAWG